MWHFSPWESRFFLFFFGGGGGCIFEATYKAYLVDDKSKLLVDIILNFMESITVFLSLFLQYLSVLVLVLCVGFSCLCWFFYHLKFGLEVFLPYNDLIEASAKFASYSMSYRKKILATLKNYHTRGSFLRIFVSEVTIFGYVFALCKDLCSWQKDIWSYK